LGAVTVSLKFSRICIHETKVKAKDSKGKATSQEPREMSLRVLEAKKIFSRTPRLIMVSVIN